MQIRESIACDDMLVDGDAAQSGGAARSREAAAANAGDCTYFDIF